MEAARVAALRGHHVTLFERSDKFGGQVNVACLAPGRQEFGGIARFLEGELERLGIGVRLNTEANVDVVLAEHPDCVIIATGSTPFLPPIPGAEGGNFTTAREVMEGRASTGQRIVVIDTHPPFTADLGEQLEKLEQIVSSGGLRAIRSHEEVMQGFTSLMSAIPTEEAARASLRKRSWPGDARFPAGRNRRALSRGVAGRETRTS